MALYIYDPNIRVATPLSVDLRRRTITELAPAEAVPPIHRKLPEPNLARHYSQEQTRSQKTEEEAKQTSQPFVLSAADLMTATVVCIDQASPWQEARALFRTHAIHHLLVTDADSRLVGLLTETDLLRYPDDPPISDEARLPVRPLMAASLETDVNIIAFVMLEKGIEAIAVMNGNRLEGIVTQKDLLKALVNHGHIEDWV